MDIQLSQIIFQIINFSIVIAALVFLLNKPVQKILKEREEEIKKGHEAAEKAIKDREAAAQAKEKALLAAQKQADDLLNLAQQESFAEKRKLIKQAEQEIEQMKHKLMASWTKEKKAMTDQLRKEMIDAISEISKKVIGASLDKKDHQELIDQELDELLKRI